MNPTTPIEAIAVKRPGATVAAMAAAAITVASTHSVKYRLGSSSREGAAATKEQCTGGGCCHDHEDPQEITSQPTRHDETRLGVCCADEAPKCEPIAGLRPMIPKRVCPANHAAQWIPEHVACDSKCDRDHAQQQCQIDPVPECQVNLHGLADHGLHGRCNDALLDVARVEAQKQAVAGQHYRPQKHASSEPHAVPCRASA